MIRDKKTNIASMAAVSGVTFLIYQIKKQKVQTNKVDFLRREKENSSQRFRVPESFARNFSCESYVPFASTSVISAEARVKQFFCPGHLIFTTMWNCANYTIC